MEFKVMCPIILIYRYMYYMYTYFRDLEMHSMVVDAHLGKMNIPSKIV